MDKQNYFNSVTQQVLELKDLAAVQVEKCFDLQKLKEMLPPETAGKIQRVIVTGCGDSYSARPCGSSAASMTATHRMWWIFADIIRKIGF